MTAYGDQHNKNVPTNTVDICRTKWVIHIRFKNI